MSRVTRWGQWGTGLDAIVEPGGQKNSVDSGVDATRRLVSCCETFRRALLRATALLASRPLFERKKASWSSRLGGSEGSDRQSAVTEGGSEEMHCTISRQIALVLFCLFDGKCYIYHRKPSSVGQDLQGRQRDATLHSVGSEA